MDTTLTTYFVTVTGEADFTYEYVDAPSADAAVDEALRMFPWAKFADGAYTVEASDANDEEVVVCEVAVAGATATRKG